LAGKNIIKSQNKKKIRPPEAGKASAPLVSNSNW
jgi:hypothetical protein